MSVQHVLCSTIDDPFVISAMDPWSYFWTEHRHHGVRWALCAKEICYINQFLGYLYNSTLCIHACHGSTCMTCMCLTPATSPSCAPVQITVKLHDGNSASLHGFATNLVHCEVHDCFPCLQAIFPEWKNASHRKRQGAKPASHASSCSKGGMWGLAACLPRRQSRLCRHHGSIQMGHRQNRLR